MPFLILFIVLENTSKGQITWSISTVATNVLINEVKLNCFIFKVKSGEISWKISNDASTSNFKSGNNS